MPHFIATSWATRARPRAANDLLNACRANTPAYKQRRVQGSAFGAPALTSTKQQPLPGVQALLHVSEKQAGLPNQREHTTVAQRAGGVARLQVQMAPRVRSRTAPTPLAASRRNTFMLRDASAQVFSSKLFQFFPRNFSRRSLRKRFISEFSVVAYEFFVKPFNLGATFNWLRFDLFFFRPLNLQ